ncbi:hypothetical protein IID22_05310 [Patescibacteria group bacterium]|nr:hypothetical protein [Patescibacteria group bacterium]
MTPERQGSGRPVFIFEEEDGGGFTEVEGKRGPLSIPHLPEPEDPQKPILIQHEDEFYLPIDPFESKGPLSERVLKADFKKVTNVNPKVAVFVTKIPGWKVRLGEYEIKTPEQIRKERDEIARGITK